MTFIVSTAATVISAPTISITNVTTNSAQLNLNSPATGAPNLLYTLRVAQGLQNTFYAPSSFPFNITLLTQNTSYTVTLFASENSQSVYNSPPSNAVGFTTPSTGTVPAQVTGVTLSAITANSITVSWTAVSNATNYSIDRNGVSILTGYTSTTYVNNGLLPSTNYVYTVAAVNASGSGPFSTGVTATTLASSALSISVSGKLLVNQNGVPVQLRGVALSSMEISPAFGSADPWAQANMGTSAGSNGVSGTIPNFTYFLSQKINCVRIPLNEEAVLGYAATTGSGAGTNLSPLNNYLQTIDNVVNTYTALGVYVVLDLHWNAPDGYLAGQQQIMADNDHSPSFWGVISARYKGNPAVLFELYNEPHCDSGLIGGAPSANQVINSGGNYAASINTGANGAGGTVTSTWNIAGYQTLLFALRSTGATNVCLLGGNTFSNNPIWWTTNPPTDPAPAGFSGTWLPQIAISHHNYNQGLTYDIVTNTATAVVALNAPGVPVVVTEWGDFNGWSSYGQGLVAQCDIQGYGCIAWNADPVASSITPNLIQTWNQNNPAATTTTAYGAGYFSWTSTHPNSIVPAPAAAVGYNTNTFNTTTLGTTTGTWQPWNFYGESTPSAAYSQNSNGSIAMSGAGNVNSGANLCTAVQNGAHFQQWSGIAFGGGFYAEAVIAIGGNLAGPYNNGGPAFWSLDVEHTSQGPYPVNWPSAANPWASGTTYSIGNLVSYQGQLWASNTNSNLGNTPPAPGSQSNGNWLVYNDFFEVDFMEWDVNANAYQFGIGNWYGAATSVNNSAGSTSNPTQQVGGVAGSLLLPSGANGAAENQYGCLWVPATASTQGYLQAYFNRQPLGPKFLWNYYNIATPASYPTQPPVNGTSAMSGMDFRHMMLILGTGTNNPMTVYSVNVWQATSANNLVI